MSDDPNEAEKKMEKQIFISGDAWLCVFDLLPPRQLGLNIALISFRFDARVDEHFKTRRRTLGFIQIGHKIGENGKKEMRIVDEHNQPLPVPTVPMHKKVVAFNGMVINYLDRNVMAFLQHFGRLFTACGTTLCIRTYNDRLLEFILRNIPSTAGVHDNSSSSPSSAADDGQPLLIKWLCSSRPGEADLPPKLFSFPTNDAWRGAKIAEINSWTKAKKEEIKLAFLSASSPANFIAAFREPLARTCVPTPNPRSKDFTNELTGERLTVKWRYGNYRQLIRCPMSRHEKKWHKWLVEAVDGWHLDYRHRWRKFSDMRNRVVVSICDVRAIGDGLLDDNNQAAEVAGPSGHQQQQ
ncbi:hypothetical protein niasHT_031444 [Heterodera trifolii]|uniref:Uncharacterized protein n=1 Tax=Heterodera trifolii TaxID=157864 RepID=A0ABD2HWS4_9BILA